MKSLKNEKGSAMLWTVLLVVIVTILLGSIMTATYAYYSYTMYTVRRQQAYFTARSATNIIIDQFSNVNQKVNASGSLVEEKPILLPDYGKTIKIDDFKLPKAMGKAEATITRKKASEDNKDVVDVKVIATYADEEYVLDTKVVQQPLYFAGIALKQLDLNGHSLTLGKGTDLYWNNSKIFEPTGKLNIAGNLVTKGDMVIPEGSKVANHNFEEKTSFGTNNANRQMRAIWSSTEYIMSNKTLKVVDDAVKNKHHGGIINAFDTTNKYCNNSRGSMNDKFGFLKALDAETDGKTSIMFKLMQLLGMDDVYADIKNSNMSLENKSTDALTIKYVNLMSLSNEMLKRIAEAEENGNISWWEKPMTNWAKNFLNGNGLTVFDMSFIEYKTNNLNTKDDDVIPLVYIDVDGGHAIKLDPETGEEVENPVASSEGLTLRIKYGKDPGKASTIGQFNDKVGNMVTGFIDNVFKIKNNMTYVIVNLGDNSSIELGCTVADSAIERGWREKKENLVFAYSIYGGTGSKVILNDNVTVVGEIYCDTLQLNGNAQVLYSNSSGSQVAKQKIAEIWTPIGYSKGAREIETTNAA